MKKLILLFFCFATVVLHAQDVKRILVEGRISAPEDNEIEGVAVYNNSSNRGVVTDADGAFKLAVALNDEIVISAIQYAVFKVNVDQRTMDTKKLGIYLNPVVNQLAEVIVQQYDLTGNLVVDVGKIKTVDLDTEWDISYETMEFDYEFTPDKWSSIPGNFAESAFYNGQEQYGINVLGGLGLIAQMVLNEKSSRSFTLKPRDPAKLIQGISDKYTYEAIRFKFNIPEGKEGDFLMFAEEHGLNSELLMEKNELVLISFLQKNAAAYRKLLDE